jgi:hypothetical protein
MSLLDLPSAPMDESLGGRRETDDVVDKWIDDGMMVDVDELELYFPIKLLSF